MSDDMIDRHVDRDFERSAGARRLPHEKPDFWYGGRP